MTPKSNSGFSDMAGNWLLSRGPGSQSFVEVVPMCAN